MEEMEDPTEQLRDKIREEAEEKKEKWLFHVALSTAIIAVLAAISGLLGGDHANEAIMEQIKASNQWSYYQAKSIKSEIAASGNRLLLASGYAINDSDKHKMAQYEQQKKEIMDIAHESEKESEYHLSRHKVLARAVTLFQIAIAISAISILARKKVLWIGSMVIAAGGIVFLIQGIF
jgi:hypothetical protein